MFPVLLARLPLVEVLRCGSLHPEAKLCLKAVVAVQTAQSPGTPPSARGQAANDSFSAPSPPAVAAPTIVTPNESAAAAGAAATLGAVAAGAVAAAAMVEHSAPSDASMGSQPSHLPDEAFCAGDALPSQSPLPLLTKVIRGFQAVIIWPDWAAIGIRAVYDINRSLAAAGGRLRYSNVSLHG